MTNKLLFRLETSVSNNPDFVAMLKKHNRGDVTPPPHVSFILRPVWEDCNIVLHVVFDSYCWTLDRMSEDQTYVKLSEDKLIPK